MKSFERFNDAKIFLGKLDYSLWDDEIRYHFEKYGKINHLEIKNKKGFGFIQYEDSKSAKAAVEEMNDKFFNGRCWIKV